MLHAVLGIEVHHDGSGRTDFILFTDEPTPRDLRIGDFAVTAVAQDAVEFDLAVDGSTHAGTFHRIGAIAGPPVLEPLGRPLLISAMPARGGLIRLVYPIHEAQALRSIASMLGATNGEFFGLRELETATRLVTGPHVVRLAVDAEPHGGRLGSRLGLEVILDPRDEHVTPVLRDLGVRDEDLTRMLAHAARLPARGRYQPTATDLPSLRLDERSIVAVPVYFSVSWTGQTPTVKSYLLMHSAPQGG